MKEQERYYKKKLEKKLAGNLQQKRIVITIEGNTYFICKQCKNGKINSKFNKKVKTSSP